MFISNDEANRRITSSANLLKRANRDADDAQAPSTPETVIEGEEVPIGSEPPEGKALAKMLGEGPRGRGAEIPEEARAAIGTVASVLTDRAAGEMFGTVGRHAFELRNGFKTSKDQYGELAKGPDSDLLSRIRGNQEKVLEVTYDKILKALDLVDDEKLRNVKQVEKLVRMAKDLSGIISNVTPKDTRDEGGTHFHIYAPEMMEETNYQTVVVNQPAQESQTPPTA